MQLACCATGRSHGWSVASVVDATINNQSVREYVVGISYCVDDMPTHAPSRPVSLEG